MPGIQHTFCSPQDNFSHHQRVNIYRKIQTLRPEPHQKTHAYIHTQGFCSLSALTFGPQRWDTSTSTPNTSASEISISTHPRLRRAAGSEYRTGSVRTVGVCDTSWVTSAAAAAASSRACKDGTREARVEERGGLRGQKYRRKEPI